MTEPEPHNGRSHQDPTVRHVVISGGRSSGKSSVGVHLAHLVHRPFLDLDEDGGDDDRLWRLLDARHPTVITTSPESFEALATGGDRGRHPDVAFIWLAHHEPGTPPVSQPKGRVSVVIEADTSVGDSVDTIIETLGFGRR